MKTMKKFILVITTLLVASDLVFSQAKSTGGLKATLDCADPNNEIKMKNAAICSKIVLSGSDAENYTFLFGIFSINQGGILKEFVIPSQEISQQVKVIISKMIPGEKLFIENAKVKNNLTDVVLTLPATKITIK